MAELAKLQDNITPFDSTVARAMVEKELGKPISEIFSEFSSEPVAAASLAQVGLKYMITQTPGLDTQCLAFETSIVSRVDEHSDSNLQHSFRNHTSLIRRLPTS